MAYYDALIAAWNGATQPPTGVTGTGLTGGMTTAQKIAAVNGWTVTGTVPTTLTVTGPQMLNCINYTEFKALTAAQQSNLLMVCAAAGDGVLGGSSNTGLLATGIMLDLFGAGTQTRAAVVALAKGTVTPWWQSPTGGNLNGPLSITDTQAAGLS